MTSMEGYQLQTKTNTKAHLTLTKNILIWPKTFAIILWTDQTNVSKSYLWRKTNKANKFHKQNIIPMVKHSGSGGVMVWDSLWPQAQLGYAAGQ